MRFSGPPSRQTAPSLEYSTSAGRVGTDLVRYAAHEESLIIAETSAVKNNRVGLLILGGPYNFVGRIAADERLDVGICFGLGLGQF
jgi:hypothetical protein